MLSAMFVKWTAAILVAVKMAGLHAFRHVIASA
jgi:hypothetical protein